MYIRLVEGPRQARTLRLSDEIALNLGASEELIGIEIIDAKRVLGQGQLPKIIVDSLPIAAA